MVAGFFVFFYSALLAQLDLYEKSLALQVFNGVDVGQS